jgi:hypothetical protein
MPAKIGRNEPCPCGSGRKYKQCHGAPGAAFEGKGELVEHPNVAARIFAWLHQRHGPALRDAFEQLLYDELWPEDGPEPEDIGDDAWLAIEMNLNEWLLAEGDIVVAGQLRQINEYVCEARSLKLTGAQRAYLEQMAARPLRLYRVVEARPGEGLLLRDELDTGSEPLFVVERTASHSLAAGRLFGARVLSVGTQLELSGALMAFAPEFEAEVLTHVASVPDELSEADRQGDVGLEIMECWLYGLLAGERAPVIVDASTGEPLRLITDHYRVLSMKRLSALLDAQADLTVLAGAGWIRGEVGADGQNRPLVIISRGALENRLELSYRTQRLANEGRSWFEAIAGALAELVDRKVEVPTAPQGESQVG